MNLTENEKHNLELVWRGMGAILETKDAPVVEQTFAPDFIQHNPWAQDGIAHVKEMLDFDFGYRAVRWVTEGDTMAYLGYYTAPNPLGENPLYCADMWRIAEGQIAEHWDALVPIPPDQLGKVLAGPGNGEAPVDRADVARNKATVTTFLDHVYNRGETGRIPELVAPGYVYHHPSAGEQTGHTALLDQLAQQPGGRMPHDRKRLVASGDLVMSYAHYFGEADRVTFDWFRLDNEHRIAEHWSISQPLVPLTEAANAHPHF
ncbi:MAG: nuclear transport factor 2 family protein [Bacteroidota bacterium]